MNFVIALPMPSWPSRRTVVIGLLAATGFAALACAAVYLSAVLFLLANKVDPRHAQFASIVDYWNAYSGDSKRRKQLVGSIAAAGIGMLVVLPLALIAAGQRRRSLHGDARFASAAEVHRAGLIGSQPSFNEPSIIVGRYRGQFLTLPGQLSVPVTTPIVLPSASSTGPCSMCSST